MTSTLHSPGGFCNQIIRNLVVSFIAEKHNLFVEYEAYDLITNMGIKLFIGKNIYNYTIYLNNENFNSIYLLNHLRCNLNANNCFLQTRDTALLIYKYLNEENNKQNIINKNPFKERYNNNNDLFIQVRLTDAARFNPGLEYYLNTISKIHFDKLYIGTDEKNHSIIKGIIEKYPDSIILDYDFIETIQFGSTNKNIILSNGTFSAIIGYLSFFSNINYPKYSINGIRWHGDMFCIDDWIEHTY